jgi:hypothetical protein
MRHAMAFSFHCVRRKESTYPLIPVCFSLMCEIGRLRSRPRRLCCCKKTLSWLKGDALDLKMLLSDVMKQARRPHSALRTPQEEDLVRC